MIPSGRLRVIFSELSTAEVNEIDQILKIQSLQTHIISQRFNITISLETFHRLKEHSWINDEVCNFYMELLKEDDAKKIAKQSLNYFANSYFYTKLRDGDGNFCYENVRKWIKNVDVFGLERLFFPLHLNDSHWALSVIDIKNRIIYYLDSIYSDITFKMLEIFNDWLHCEFQKSHLFQAFDKFKVIQCICPQQVGGVDCGIFMLTFAHIIYCNQDIKLMEQSQVPFMRKKIALSIIRGSLQVCIYKRLKIVNYYTFYQDGSNTSALVGVENKENKPPRSREHGKMSKPLNTHTAHDDNDTAHDGSIRVIGNKEKKMKTSSNVTIHIYLSMHKCDLMFRRLLRLERYSCLAI